MTPETKLKNAVIKYLKTVSGLWYYKSSDRFRSGIPDLIICFKGMFVAIELKVDAPVEPLQKYTIAKIKEANGIATVCRSVVEVKSLIESLSSQ